MSGRARDAGTIAERMARAEAKRERTRARNLRLVAVGGMQMCGPSILIGWVGR